MSAVPRQPGGGYAGLRMTAEEYLALGETNERYELIDGVVCMSPKPGSPHHDVQWLIFEQARAFAKQQGGRCFCDFELVLSDRLVYAPDIMCFAPGRVVGAVKRVDSAPELVIEVLSPATAHFDLTRKRDDYDRFGVGEYWTVDPATARVRCFRRGAGRLEEQAVLGDRVASAAWQGFVLDLRPLRGVDLEEL
jgi:Uma2 family endonuclease